MKLLIVTAVFQERDAVLAGLGGVDHDVIVAGVGPAAAAAATARHLAMAGARGLRYDGVVNAGVAGAIDSRVSLGDVVVATMSVSAELGVRLPDRFQPVEELGFGSSTIACLPGLTAGVSGHRGPVLTLATITGTDERARQLACEHPKAVAEAMEGFGVATAASQADLPFAEVRTITNSVGDRNVSGWDWRAGFAALSTAMSQLPGEEKPAGEEERR